MRAKICWRRAGTLSSRNSHARFDHPTREDAELSLAL